MGTEPISMTIVRRDLQADGIVVLDLARPDGAPPPPFEAGAHVEVEIAPGLVRHYSLCGDPADRRKYRLGILRDPASRGGSAAVHETFLEGVTVKVGAPRNNFPLEPGAELTVLVGGGIGVTPMIAMAHSLHREGRAFVLHYCARDPAKAAFLSELADAPFAPQVRLHFDNGPEAQRFDPARDLPETSQGAHVYVCGPAGFMAWVREGCTASGYPAARMHQEFFSAEVDTGGDAFEVVLSRSGRTVPVPAGKTIVAALAEAGVKVKTSCSEGVCGTCLCDVVEGMPDHRDVYLTEEEKGMNDQILLCCSRSRTPRLVLDL